MTHRNEIKTLRANMDTNTAELNTNGNSAELEPRYGPEQSEQLMVSPIVKISTKTKLAEELMSNKIEPFELAFKSR